MPLSNPWVGYFTRSYEQIKAAVLTALATFTPEITDHTESNPIVKEVSIWAGIAEQLGYYIDNMAREAFIGSARLQASGMAIASQLDYRVHAWVAASAEVTFYTDAPVSSDYVIPAGTVVSTNTGVNFVTTEATTILTGNTTANAPVTQHEVLLSSISFLSAGAAFQSYQIPTDIADGQVTVKVNGLTWTPQSTFAYSTSTDKHYIQTVDGQGIPVIRFGDGVMGKSPAAGESVIVKYYRTQGLLGNVGQGSLTEIVTSLPMPPGATSLEVVNNVRASGGLNNETLDSLRHRIPLSLRVMDRAVTRQDYIDSAELVAGVAKAGVVYECGKWVDIYIVPEGGGIASDVLVGQVLTFIDPRRMITTLVRVFPAGEVRTAIAVKLHVQGGFDTVVVIQAVKDALTEFLSYQNQEIGGTLFLSDLYEVIEAVDGVLNSQILSTVFTPYAQPTPPTTLTLDWVATPAAGITVTAEWKLQAIDATHFHLFRNEQFLATVTVGVPYVSSELTFTVNTAAYAVNDAWTFWTYPSNIGMLGSVVLQEPSIFVSLDSDLTVTLF